MTSGMWENPKLGPQRERSAHPPRKLVFNASMRALEGEAKRKYFEHAGALLTADGTDDALIQLESVPKGEEFSF